MVSLVCEPGISLGLKFFHFCVKGSFLKKKDTVLLLIDLCVVLKQNFILKTIGFCK